MAKVDVKTFGLYGDTIHHNDGTHLDGGIGIAEERKMKRLWIWITKDPNPFYEIPRGKIGNCFLKIQTTLFKLVYKHHWNSEKPLIFSAYILTRESVLELVGCSWRFMSPSLKVSDIFRKVRDT